MFKKILLIALILTISAIPRSFNYQGKLMSSEGVAINDTLNIIFRIYNDSISGLSLYTDTINTIISKGLFSVIINDIPESLNFNSQYYMEIQIESEILSPRNRISSVPYSFRASIADSISGGISIDNGWFDSGTIVRLNNSNDSVGIGLSNPTAKLDVNGDINTNGIFTRGDKPSTIIYTRCSWKNSSGTIGTCTPPTCPSNWIDLGITGNSPTHYNGYICGYQERVCSKRELLSVIYTTCGWKNSSGTIVNCTPPECPTNWTDLGSANNVVTSYDGYICGYQERICVR